MTDERRPRVLVVDDDPDALELCRAALEDGYELVTALGGDAAAAMIRPKAFDVVLSDITMPGGLDGLQLLRAIREIDRDVPVLLSTGGPTLESAIKALEYGALRYLTKPVAKSVLREAIDYAAAMNRITLARRETSVLLSGSEGLASDRAGLEAAFTRALSKLWLAFQPIISTSRGSVYAFEALVRSDDPELGRPSALVEAAERLGRVWDLGRTVRRRAAEAAAELPDGVLLFVNLHPRDLDDAFLAQRDSPLARVASRVVLEVSERSSLEMVKDARRRLEELRSLGFRIALDDMGAGHAGLATFAQLQPNVVKLDMSLVRGCDREPTRRRLIRSMVEACRDVDVDAVCEGVETREERDAILQCGCDLLQGYFFAKPTRSLAQAALGNRN